MKYVGLITWPDEHWRWLRSGYRVDALKQWDSIEAVRQAAASNGFSAAQYSIWLVIDNKLVWRVDEQARD